MPVALYRFYNFDRDRGGEPFALCDKHYLDQRVPASCVLEKIADSATTGCVVCAEKRQPRR